MEDYAFFQEIYNTQRFALFFEIGLPASDILLFVFSSGNLASLGVV